MTTDIMKLSPVEHTEATLRNKGLAKFDAKGNVVVGDGNPDRWDTVSEPKVSRIVCQHYSHLG